MKKKVVYNVLHNKVRSLMWFLFDSTEIKISWEISCIWWKKNWCTHLRSQSPVKKIISLWQLHTPIDFIDVVPINILSFLQISTFTFDGVKLETNEKSNHSCEMNLMRKKGRYININAQILCYFNWRQKFTRIKEKQAHTFHCMWKYYCIMCTFNKHK